MFELPTTVNAFVERGGGRDQFSFNENNNIQFDMI
jgi:hypothetical protein